MAKGFLSFSYLIILSFSIFPSVSLATDAAVLSQKSGNKQKQPVEVLSIETNPLAWLDSPIGCQGFREQVQVRYAPFGKFVDLPKSKKKELRHVLGVACSEKLAHCQFKNCRRLSTAEAASGNDSTGNEELFGPNLYEMNDSGFNGLGSVQRWRHLKEMVSETEAKQKVLIADALKSEQADGLVWQRFSIKAEMEMVKEREKLRKEHLREVAKEREENESNTIYIDESGEEFVIPATSLPRAYRR